MAERDEFFYNNYNTPLESMAEVINFHKFLKDASAKVGHPVTTDELNDYDLQGAFKKYGNKVFDSENFHGTDEFKKPNHPTFSDQSIYHGAPAPWGGKHEGGKWIEDEDGNTRSYQPSAQMLDRTHDARELKRYMDKYEPSITLILPDSKD